MASIAVNRLVHLGSRVATTPLGAGIVAPIQSGGKSFWQYESSEFDPPEPGNWGRRQGVVVGIA
jgi:hypothetical protein